LTFNTGQKKIQFFIVFRQKYFENFRKKRNSQAFLDTPRRNFQKMSPKDFEPGVFDTLQHQLKKIHKNYRRR
jgi:hypothetical protein